MLQCYFTPRPPSRFITCQLSTSSVRSHPSPPPAPPLSDSSPPLLSFAAKSIPDSVASPACALQCSHFQSYAPLPSQFFSLNPIDRVISFLFLNVLGAPDVRTSSTSTARSSLTRRLNSSTVLESQILRLIVANWLTCS